MNNSLRKKIYSGFIIASILIAIISYFYNKSTDDFIDSSVAVQESNRKISQMETVLSLLKDAETGERGYIITKREVFLEPYHAAIASLDKEMQELTRLTANDRHHQQNLAQLQKLIGYEIKHLNNTIQLVKQTQYQQVTQIVIEGRGKQILDSIRFVIGRMQQQERNLLHSLENKAQRAVLANYVANYVGIAITVLLFGIGIFIINRDLNRREELEKELMNKNESLLSLNEELQASIEELHTSSETINSYLKILEEKNSALEHLNAELDDLYNNAPLAYHSLDRQGCYLRVNDTELRWTGYTRDELIGESFIQVLTSASRQKLKETHPVFTQAGHVEDVEFEMVRKDGSILPILLSSRATYSEGGLLLFTKSAFTDHTALRKAKLEIADRNTKLEQANKELEAFSYSISHDLQSPLHTIAGFAAVLAQEYGSGLDAEAKRLLAIIEQSAFRMSGLIHDLLHFSRLGRASLFKTRTEMYQLVGSVIEEMTRSGQLEKYKFKVDALPAVYVDKKMIRQVWINLLSNATKFSANAANPLICISSRELPGFVEFCVRDNGIGFAMNEAGDLFGVFKRLFTAKDFTGNGIGLAIVERIVTSHGGEVRAQAEVNRGAVFYFTIPNS